MVVPRPAMRTNQPSVIQRSMTGVSPKADLVLTCLWSLASVRRGGKRTFAALAD